MKSTAIFISALASAGFLRAGDAAMPPDPLVQGLVPVPFSTADLIVRSKTQAAGLNLWRLAGELEAMSTAQVRTITFGGWRAYRRYCPDALYASTAGMSLWVDRDLADVVATMMFNGSWEDMDDSIGDLDLEHTAGYLWAQLAARDWKKAAALLRKLSGEETTEQFNSLAAAFARLTPAQATQFVAIMAPKLSQESLTSAVNSLAENITATHGLKAAGAWAKTLKSNEAREAALERVADMEAEPPPPPDALSFSDDTLGKLRALDLYDGPWTLPYPLFRAVRTLAPAEALKLGEQDAARPLTKVGAWLRWMLFMRAAEGDPLVATRIACNTPFGDSVTLTEAFAVRADQAIALEDIRHMTEVSDRAAALRGLLTHADITDSAKWLTEIAGLKVDYHCAAPLFARLGAAGRGREVCEAAGKLDRSSDGDALVRYACNTWLLTDVRAFFRFHTTMESSSDPAQRAIADAARDSIYLLNAFSARELPLNEDVIPAKYLDYDGFAWSFFAFEERETGFQFLERHADDVDYHGSVMRFAEVALRFEPERAAALITRAIAANLAKSREMGELIDLKHLGPANVRSLAMRSQPRLVQFWPEKAVAIAAPSNEKDWEGLCAEMVRHHGLRSPAFLKDAPRTAREAVAKCVEDAEWCKYSTALVKLSPSQRDRLAEKLRAAK